jgi:hypothetical protein
MKVRYIWGIPTTKEGVQPQFVVDNKGAVQKEKGSPLRFKKEVIQYGA